MSCPQKRKAMKVLLGELGPDSTSKMLAHCRVCGECREAFDFAATTISKSGGVMGMGAGIADGPAPSSSEVSRPVAFRTSGGTSTRRNRRVIVVCAAFLVALFVAGVTRGRAGAAGPAEPSTESVWKRLLAEGTPVVQSPSGVFEDVPRVIIALAPPGSSGFALMILDASGEVVLRRPCVPGEDGCFAEPIDVDAPGGAFKATRVLVPFPSDGGVAFEPGRRFGVVVTTGGGQASPAATFQFSPSGGGLHAAPVESR